MRSGPFKKNLQNMIKQTAKSSSFFNNEKKQITTMASPLHMLKSQILYPPAIPNQFSELKKVEFPPFKGIQCNMMPFRLNDRDSMPKEYRSYWDLIDACDIPKHNQDGIWFLTVTESQVKKNTTQRRPGIHTDKHPKNAWGGPWGGMIGGIYMASTGDDTCRVWNCHVEKPGHMGDCEHLRDQLQNPISLQANQLVWMTDSCPHEALPQNKESERQFFRLVSPEVGLWYKAHSTPNPLVELPSNIKIIEGNKFTK
jgi:hypothetical protein